MPSKTIRPRSGLVKPATISKQVVLPAPFGPMTPRISPGATSKRHVVDGDHTTEAARHPVDDEDRAGGAGLRVATRGDQPLEARPLVQRRRRVAGRLDHAVPLAQRVDAVAAGERVVQEVAAADQDAAEAVGQEDHDEQPGHGERGLADHAHAGQGGQADDEQRADERAERHGRGRR